MTRTLDINAKIDAAAKDYSGKMNGFLSGDDAGNGEALKALA